MPPRGYVTWKLIALLIGILLLLAAGVVAAGWVDQGNPHALAFFGLTSYLISQVP